MHITNCLTSLFFTLVASEMDYFVFRRMPYTGDHYHPFRQFDGAPSSNAHFAAYSQSLPSLANDINTFIDDPHRESSKPRFSISDWSDCSVTCDNGVRSRVATCVALQGITADTIKLPDYECDEQIKPSLVQPCQMMPCASIKSPLNFHEKSDARNEIKSDNSNKFVEMTAADEISIPDENLPPQPTTRHKGIYRWEYGEWTPCSASCLGGHQKTKLKCVDLNRNQDVALSFCNAKKKPVEMTRNCNHVPCLPEWEIGNFSACSHSCGGGIRTRIVRCIRTVAHVAGSKSTLILPEAQCSDPKPTANEPCGLIDCPPMWHVGQWSDCSTNCGAGEQTRDVVCEQQNALGIIHIFENDTACSYSNNNSWKPSTVRLCNLGSCDSPLENTENFSSFRSSIRNESTRRRHVISESDENRTIKINNNQNTKTENNLDEDNDERNQLNQGHRKLTLDVGGFANLYEGTSVKIKCPVNNDDRDKIFWTKDGKRVINNAHIKVSTNGALRIFHARIEDAGVFACFADGERGNVTLTFKPSNIISHQEPQLKKNNNRFKNKQSKNKQILFNKSHYANDSFNVQFNHELMKKMKQSLLRLGERQIFERLERLNDTKKVRLDFATGEWSRCSQLECGRPDGAQVRMLRCRLYINQLASFVDDEICISLGVLRPPGGRPCTNNRCPRWDTSSWSECSKSRCLREKIAIQKRSARCIYNNGTKADYNLCNRKARPKIKKECRNSNCTAEWRPSLWGKCSKKCGDGGVQMRLLRCVWSGTHKAAGRHCNRNNKPLAIRMCDAKSLQHAKCHSENDENKTNKFWKTRVEATQNLFTSNDVCEDDSRFCTILNLFHSCDDQQMRTRCCFTCNFLNK